MEYNSTVPSGSPTPEVYVTPAVNTVLRLFLVEVTGALCIALNSLNLALLHKVPNCFGESTTLLFKALAVVDLTTGVIIMVSEAFYVLTDLANSWDLFCVLIYPCIVLFGILSAMLLACLSFDKLIAITHPLRYSHIVTKSRVTAVVIVVVSISAMNVIGYWALILAGSTDVMYFHPESRYCRMYLNDTSGSRSKAITLLQLFGFLCMFLPLIAITYVNLRLLYIVHQHNQRRTISPYAKGGVNRRDTAPTLVKSSPRGTPNQSPNPDRREPPVSPSSPTKNPPGERRNDRRTSSRVSLPLINLKILRQKRESTVSTGSRQRKSHYKGLRTVLLMVMAYYLAWLPLLVDICLNIVNNQTTSATFEFVTFVMAYSNSWWNALVYLIMNGTYRAAAYRIMRCNRCL